MAHGAMQQEHPQTAAPPPLPAAAATAAGVVRSTVHARIGLLGNPSDGFGGASLSLSLSNWAATVSG